MSDQSLKPKTQNPKPLPPDPVKDLLRERFAMSSLLEFARLLTPVLGPIGIIKSILRTIMGKALIPESFAYLSDKKDGRFYLTSRSGFRGVELPDSITFETIETWLLKPPERTKTTIPIFDSEQQDIIGFLGFGKSLAPETDISAEQNYLESLSLLTGIALTNAALFEAEKERERFAAQLELAREIQQSLLPQKLPKVEDISFTAYSKQSELVGGDYYDVIKLSGSQALIAIADVVGKGISAAILMSNLQASLHALIIPLQSGLMGLKIMVRELNRLLYENTGAERYITAIFAIVDSKKNAITSIVCGHPKPILYLANGEFRELETNGVPLGIIPNYSYEASETPFSSGSRCAFYTDGLSEALTEGKMLGDKGVGKFLADLKDKPANIIESALFEKTDLKISDDVTIVIAKRE